MPITIGPADSATIGAAEYFLASDSAVATYQSTACILQAMLDLANLAAGDQYEFKLYEKVDGANARVVYQAVVTGVQSPPIFPMPAFIVGAGWEVSAKKLAGTDRVIGWSLNKVTAA